MPFHSNKAWLENIFFINLGGCMNTLKNGDLAHSNHGYAKTTIDQLAEMCMNLLN